MLVLLASWRGQIFGGTLYKAAFGLEIGEGLSAESDQFIKTEFAGLILDKLDEFSANPLIFVSRADEQERQFTFILLGITVQRNARNRVLIDLKDVVISQLLFNARPGAFD